MTEQVSVAKGATGGQDSGSGWRDDPIVTVEQDRLHRAPFAQHTARLIDENHSAESSVVYGLEGPWGSGKSSVISLISSALKKPSESRWSVVHFTPWATTGTEGLLAEFFAALSEAAPRSKRSKKLRDQITAYADIARPFATLIPVAGGAVSEASQVVTERLRKPWNVAFEEVSKELRALERPILVVVDDIDRLQPAELLDLLRVVRLLGRFPGVDFLLAYDEQTLVETLQDPTRGRVSSVRARAFMEKIVQYPLSLPPLLTGKIVNLLDAGLTEILTPERTETGFDIQRFSPIILITMPSQLTTPRAIERFLAQVREQFRVHDLDEMNDVDLILATFLRVQFPDLFTALQRWKGELTRKSGGRIMGVRNDEGPNWDELLDIVEDPQGRKDALVVLQTLFPLVKSQGGARTAPRRFAHPDYFDRYLAQTIPEGDIPDAAISRALTQAASGTSDELRALLLATDDERVTLALSKIQDRYRDITEISAPRDAPERPVTMELLAAGMSIIDELDDAPGSSWISTLRQTTYWIANVLRLVLDDSPDADVDSALAACTNTRRRAQVISVATETPERVRPEVQRALRETRVREAQRIVPDLLADLRQGDASEHETGPFLYSLVEQAGLLDGLAAAIREGIAAQTLTPEDVAARLVAFGYLVGGSGRPSSAAFSGDLFTKITGIGADSTDHDKDEEWHDTSWSSRRKFASKYIHPLQEEER